jgi:ubiquinone/menaquinone biosynthesis C-methylase UbiE
MKAVLELVLFNTLMIADYAKSQKEAILELGIIGASSVLDVGCGNGEITFYISQNVLRSAGIDPDENSIQSAKKKFNNNLEFCVAQAEKLCYPDFSFSSVLFIESLHHVPIGNQIEALNESYRVLVPRGRLFVTEPIHRSVSFGQILKFYADEKEQKQNAIKAIETAVDTKFTLVAQKEINIEYHCRGFDDLNQYSTMPKLATQWNKNTQRDIEKILEQCELSSNGDFILDYSASVWVLEKR